MEPYRFEIFLCIGLLEEGVSVLSYNVINCYLHFARFISSVSKMVFEDISMFLEAGRRRTDAATAEHL
jgi:hypothetical protein